MLKTISCGELRQNHVGQDVTLAGWVDRRRDHGNLVFIDLRDRSGIVQVVFNPELNPEAHETAERLRNEWVVQVKGTVNIRPEGTQNTGLPTGAVEVTTHRIEVLNQSKTPPFYINDESDDVDELLRLKYRYLDLRRPRMRDMLMARHNVVKYIRDFLSDRGFLEVETPILIKSTPEGARDYLVPSRLYPGKFYALPQSPQQLKQLLMVAGVERYFQIARCFRDEDPRGDRQPEFTQLDLEMSFVERDDVLDLTEELYTTMLEKLFPNKKIVKPFPRLQYADVMARYGSDKPDMRYGLEMSVLNDVLKDTEFRVFRSIIDGGGIIKGFAAPGLANMPRRQLDDLVEFTKQKGAQGLVYIALTGSAESVDDLTAEDIKSPVAKVLPLETMKAMAKQVGAQVGDLVLIVAGPPKTTNQALSALRTEMAKRLDLTDPDTLAFAFVIDFPMFEWDEVEKRWDAAHHAFTQMHEDDIQYLDTDPGRIRAHSYDMVCNGLELASGSIRIHERDMQVKVFKTLGYDEDQINHRFKQLLDAFEYGAPPHGGIAPGIDRFMMILQNVDSIRETIAFPKTQSFLDPLFDAPDIVEDKQLKELHIKIVE